MGNEEERTVTSAQAHLEFLEWHREWERKRRADRSPRQRRRERAERVAVVVATILAVVAVIALDLFFSWGATGPVVGGAPFCC